MEARPETHPLYYEIQRRGRIIKKHLLLCPGPVMVSERVKNALLHTDIGHREEEFCDLLHGVRNKLSEIFGVRDLEKFTTVVISGSGTAANESVFSSIGSDTKVLVLSNGEFGERLIELAGCHQLSLSVHRLEWGEPFSPEQIEKSIQEHDPDLIAMVHHETSTGMLNPIEKVGELVSLYRRKFFVDAVSSLGAQRVDVEKNQITFCTSSSNKALSGICGLSFVCGLRSAFESLKNVRSKTTYLNLYRHFQYQTDLSQTPNTPSLTALFALDAALDELLEFGLSNQIEHYRVLAEILREEMRGMGLSFIIPERVMSNVLTTVELPDRISFAELKRRLKERGYVVYGGKGPLMAKVFQVANIGALTENHIRDFLRTLRWVLSILLVVPPPNHYPMKRSIPSPRLPTF